jgi:hypothetical protein
VSGQRNDVPVTTAAMIALHRADGSTKSVGYIASFTTASEVRHATARHGTCSLPTAVSTAVAVQLLAQLQCLVARAVSVLGVSHDAVVSCCCCLSCGCVPCGFRRYSSSTNLSRRLFSTPSLSYSPLVNRKIKLKNSRSFIFGHAPVTTD